MLTVSINEQYDKVKLVKDLLKSLGNIRVLVGVPEEKGQRPAGDKGQKITNPQLVFIHTHGTRGRATMRRFETSPALKMYNMARGSVLRGIPPRPIIEPALTAHKEELLGQLKKAASTHLFTKAQQGASLKEFKRASMMGQNFARGWFTDPRNGWAPNAPSTIRRKGSDRPLIDTGEMRKSIIGIVGTKK